MIRRIQALGLLAAASIFGAPYSAGAADASATFIAGLAPQRRPEGAPVVREFAAGADWKARALTGIAAPVPPSLGFLDRQGAWYTPFDRPGMPGPYDLRQWHAGAGKAATQGR